MINVQKRKMNDKLNKVTDTTMNKTIRWRKLPKEYAR